MTSDQNPSTIAALERIRRRRGQFLILLFVLVGFLILGFVSARLGASSFLIRNGTLVIGLFAVVAMIWAALAGVLTFTRCPNCADFFYFRGMFRQNYGAFPVACQSCGITLPKKGAA